jgi:hypothetical protein
MTPDKNFKMWPSTKAMLAVGTFRDSQDRFNFKRMMIDAQLSDESARRASSKSKEVRGSVSRGAVAPDNN